MKQIIEIFIEDIKSIYQNWAALVIVLFLMIMPSAYAWFNIYASWDPYSNTKGILVGVANNDSGAAYKNQKIHAGQDIVSELKKNNKLGWQFGSEEDILSKVKKGKYYAAIVIPKDFSERFLTAVKDQPVQAEITYYVNEKINAIAPKITSSGAGSVVESITKNFIKTASGVALSISNDIGLELQKEAPALEKMKRMIYSLEAILPELENTAADMQGILQKVNKAASLAQNNLEVIEGQGAGLEDVRKALLEAANGAEESSEAAGPFLVKSMEEAEAVNRYTATAAARQASGESDLDKEAILSLLEREKSLLSHVNGLLSSYNQAGSSFHDEADRLKRTAGRIESLEELVKNGSIDPFIKESDAAGEELNQIQAALTNSLDQGLKTAGQSMRQDLESSAQAIQELKALMPDADEKAEEGLQTIQTRTNTLSALLAHFPEIKKQVNALAGKMREFDKDYNLYEVIDFLKNDQTAFSGFFAEPVLLNKKSLFPIPNYGSAMAPFYTVLSLWVGGTLLISLLSTEIQKESYRAYQIYFGRGAVFVTIAIIQGLIVSVGDLFLLNVYAVEKVWFILFSLFTSLVFMTIIYTLASVFGNVGKGLSILIMVLQISGSGGTFPVQMEPAFFQSIHPFLPFTYAIRLLREASGGIVKQVVISSAGILSLFFIAAVGAGLFLKKPLHKILKKTNAVLSKSRIFE